ncbi:MAG: ABC transporter permease [Tannerellaceae bacterium]|jgi:ABC-2 type transport system permease protein|nr:ABC transporter permease [Tannerellaceae bacterium]
MNKIGIIIKREYLRRVSKKSFLLLTLLIPFLMAALVFVPLWLASIKSGELKTIAVIDATGKYASLLQDTESYHFIHSEQTMEDYRKAADKEIFAILSITGDLLENPQAAALYSEKQIPMDLSRLVNQTFSRQLESEKLASFQIPNLKEIIAESKVDFSIQTIKWTEDGKESASSAMIASIAGMGLTIFIYMFILMYGSMVMQGVLEEKTNRIVELMVSSVRPFDLMMGKIIGLAFVGLTQLFLWGIMTSCLLLGGMFLMGGGIEPSVVQEGMPLQTSAMGVDIEQILQTINFAEIGLFFVIYFIGGYLLYASIFAAIGASVSQQEDTQQFMTPIMILLVFALYAGIYSMENPDGPLAFWCSLIPLSSPVVMMMRLPFEIALWEKLLSITLLYLTAFGMVWLSAKIYRIGILMYGKKPSIKEIIKWVRYK